MKKKSDLDPGKTSRIRNTALIWLLFTGGVLQDRFPVPHPQVEKKECCSELGLKTLFGTGIYLKKFKNNSSTHCTYVCCAPVSMK
jgi:hypothetical protein